MASVWPHLYSQKCPCEELFIRMENLLMKWAEQLGRGQKQANETGRKVSHHGCRPLPNSYVLGREESRTHLCHGSQHPVCPNEPQHRHWLHDLNFSDGTHRCTPGWYGGSRLQFYMARNQTHRSGSLVLFPRKSPFECESVSASMD